MSDGRTVIEAFRQIRNAKTLGELLGHDSLFDAYPELYDLPISHDVAVSKDGTKSVPLKGQAMYVEGQGTSKDYAEQIVINLKSIIESARGVGSYK